MMFPASDIKKIAVFRALQLGDLLCAIPAFRALRAAYPSAHVTLIGMPWMHMLPARYPHYFDEVISFPGYPGLPEQPVDAQATIAFLQHMREQRFDLALQMQGNGSVVNPMVELFDARHTAGFFQQKDYYPGTGFVEYPMGVSEIHRHLRLMEHLGVDATNDELEFPVTEKDRADLREATLGLEKYKYVCVHPGSRGGWRQWPPECFALMAGECQQMGFEVVVTGTKEEMPIVQKLLDHMETPPIVAAGRTNLGPMAALIEDAAGLISNCTGVSHIAAALKTKSVVISMDGEPGRWAPLNTRLHTTIDWTRMKDIETVRRAVRKLFATAG